MKNEDTIFDFEFDAEAKKQDSKKSNVDKNISFKEKSTYAVGGAVAGVSATLVGQTLAAKDNKELSQEEVTEAVVSPEMSEESHYASESTTDTSGEGTQVSSVRPDAEVNVAPEPEDVIIATATGVRVAQVDDNVSFSTAFADARSQVGPGGVFEWHGRVYSTYYKDEWDNMTLEQRHEYQASIDYQDVISNDVHTQHVAHHNASSQESQSVEDSQSVSHSQTSSDDTDVRVLAVEQTDLDNNGIPENSAMIEVNGHRILIVDVDRDGDADIAIADFNNDGELEMADISSDNLAMPPMTSGEDVYYAQTNNTPDYMNDANVGDFEI